MHRSILLVGLLFLTAPTGACYAQLDRTFDRLFNEFLVVGFRLSPGDHGEHFLPVAEQAVRELTPALNSLIAGNVSSFPLSATVSVRYDLSAGEEVVGSLGPIFAEAARTLEQGRFSAGFNFTHLNLSRYRGLPTEAFRFTFTHEDVGIPGLGDSVEESDLMDLFLDLHLDANSYVFFLTYGATSRFDVGIAVPIVNVSLEGRARGVVHSFTFAIPDEEPQHQFGDDPLNPALEKEVLYRESATGVGDVALRMKFHALQRNPFDLAVLLDLRMPTGARQNFLGTGKPTLRLAGILSHDVGGGTAHLNLGYERRSADLDSDELTIRLGFDQEVIKGLTLAGEFIGDVDLNENEAIWLFPGTLPLVNRSTIDGEVTTYTRHIDLSNIPEQSHDHTFDLALGVRVRASSRFFLLTNVLVPLNDGGLRSNTTATLGLSAYF